MAEQAKEAVRFKKKRHRLRRWVFVLLIIVIAFVLYSYRDNLTPDALYISISDFFIGTSSDNKFPIKIDGTSVQSAGLMGSNIALLTDTCFKIYSQNGNELVNHQHGYSNPAMVVTNKKAVIFDRGGKALIVYSRFKNEFDIKPEYAIVTADMNERGNLAIVTGTRGYIAELDVYDKNYNNIFKWYSAENYVVDVSISPDGQKAAVALINAENGDVKSSIYVFEFDKNEPLAKNTYKGTSFFSVKWQNNDALTAIGDDKTLFFNGNGKQTKEYNYNGRELRAYSDKFNNNIVLILSRYGLGRQSEMIELNSTGTQISNATLDTSAKCVDVDNNGIAVLSGNKVMLFDNNMKLMGTADVPVDATIVLKSGINAYVAGNSSFEKLGFK
jgi:WD40 repeat protein